jgi:hypothetical protein
MSYEFHTEEYKDCTIRIVQDDSPCDPRTDYDHIGTMIPWDNERRGYVYKDLNDHDRESFLRGLAANQLAVRAKLIGKEYSDYEVDDDDPDYLNLPDTADLIEMACIDNVILPYDYYSGSQGGVREGDWGRSTGYIYVPMNVARDNWSGTDEEIRSKAEACLRAELTELDNWVNGNVAGWIAETPEGETIASVWGYYPDEYPKEWDYPISEARSHIDQWHVDQHELETHLCMNI